MAASGAPHRQLIQQIAIIDLQQRRHVGRLAAGRRAGRVRTVRPQTTRSELAAISAWASGTTSA